MKKTLIIVIILIVIGIASAYLIDSYRMSNNMDVIFGTWRNKYAPPIKSGEILYVNTLKESGETLELNEIETKIDNHILICSLPANWQYDVLERKENEYDGGIKVYGSNSNAYMNILIFGENLMGVCGTGLEEKEMKLDSGKIANVGYYGKEDWEFVFINEKEIENCAIWALNCGLKGKDATKALEIIKTVKIERK